jgi:hypothetical protein
LVGRENVDTIVVSKV